MSHCHDKQLIMIGLFLLFIMSITATMLPGVKSDDHGFMGRDPPNVDSWMMNMDTRVLTLTFNDIMNVSSLDVTGITIQDAETATVSYTLHDSTSTSPNGATVVIDLSTNDFNSIAGTSHLAKSLNTSWLTMADGAIQNMNGTNASSIIDGSALQTNAFTADATAPTLPLVHIFSNYSDPTLAKVGDNITIRFTASEPLNSTSVSVLIDTDIANIVGDGLFWNASYIMQQNDAEENVMFAIDFSDMANNPGATVTSATDGSFVIFDKSPPSSSVDNIVPYWRNSATTITATANDTSSGVKNVALSYRFCTDNSSWRTWVNAGVESVAPWTWNFTFVNASGFYQFNSIATDNATNHEPASGSPDALCGYDAVAPTSSVDPIAPYWNTVNPLTINASASDGLSGVKNVTLYYRFSADNASWSGWVNAGVDTASSWSRNFTFPNGTGYYQFTSAATDYAKNAETGPGTMEALCVYDVVVPPSGFIATVSGTSMINLAWIKGLNADSTRIQRKTGWYPHNLSDGTTVYNGSNATCASSGLSPGTLYFYRAWSFNKTISTWSTMNVSASATTQSGAGGSPGPGGGPIDTSLPVSRPGGPYQGAVSTVIVFNGSASYDADSSIVRYDWRFATGDTWHNNSGATLTHIYPFVGTFTVTLRVFDAGGNVGMNTTTATITATPVNRPPIQPTVRGPTAGTKNFPYTFSFTSIDPDGDAIRYSVDWGDGTMNVSSQLASGTTFMLSHAWASNRVFLIDVSVKDQNNASSTNTTVTLPIDATPVEGYGYVIDTNGDGVLDSFFSNSTGQTSTMQGRSNGTYLLDFNGNGVMDHVYNPETNTISVLGPATALKKSEGSAFTWWVLAPIILALVVIVLLVLMYRTGRI